MKKTGILLFLWTLCLASCRTSADQDGVPSARIEPMPKNVTCTTACIDSTGFIWIGTEDSGLYHFDGTNCLHYYATDEEGSLSSSQITRVFSDSRGDVWVGTDKGVDRYDAETGAFHRIPSRGEMQNITSLTEDGKGDVLAVAEEGVFRYDETANSFRAVVKTSESGVVKAYAVQNGEMVLVRNFSIDRYDSDFNLIKSYTSKDAIVNSWKVSSKYVLLMSFPTLKLFDLETNTFKPLTGEIAGMNNPDKLTFVSPHENSSIIFAYDGKYYFYNFASDTLISEDGPDFPFDTDISASATIFVLKDKTGGYWIMTRTKGLAKAKPAVNSLYFPLERYAAEHQIKSIATGRGKVWMVSDGHHLVTFDTESRSLEVEEIGHIIGRVLGEDRVCDIFWDEASGRLFLTADANVWEYTIDPKGNRSLTGFYHPSYLSEYIKIAMDKKGGIWGGGRSGTLQYLQDEQQHGLGIQFSDVNLNGLTPHTRVTAIRCLDNGLIAAAFSNPAIGFIDPVTRQNHVVYLSSVEGLRDILSLCPDNEGRLWIGTATGGLFFLDLQTYKVEKSQALSKGRLSNISRDDKGRMFVVSGSNLFQYIPSSGTFRTILVSSGASPSALCNVEDNEMLAYIGGELNVIERNAATAVSRIPEVAGVMFSDEKGRMLDIVRFTEAGKHRIVLGESENNLKVTISPAELIDFGYLNCKVFFKGVFREWRDFSETSFSLDNIPYGTHKLSFTLINPAEGTSGSTYEMKITVLRPWYSSTVAKIILLLIVLGILECIFRLLKKSEASERKAEIAEEEKEMQQRLNQRNIDFFTDISHEFRTPLTIISGSTETLLQDSQLTNRQGHLVQLVQRNSDRMLKLVGQLMDLNKLDHGKMVLNVKACDISSIIRNVYEAFENTAERKEIAFKLDCPDYQLCWADSDKFEKIVYNLLSNAFKYTPSGGSVTVRARTGNAAEVVSLFPGHNLKDGNYLIVSVSDTGIGIPDDRKKDIFTRFTRINPDSRTGGTGIGLSFSKSLVEVHHGMIGLTDGKADDGSASGSVFFFALPADSSAYTPEELSRVESARQNTVDGSKYKSEYTLHNTPAPGDGKRTKVLVIDDDSEILYYLALILSSDYEVITRSDAVSGYKKIEEIHPDVVISDIMMVEMDGLKLCRMVKDNICISHIPFILLTAKTTTEDQIEGMNAGADAYIVKPFDPDYLKAVIASLLRNRDNVRKALGASTSIDDVEVEENVISAQDKKLLEKIYAIMEENLMESELNIRNMTVNLGMSRTKLYYKIKGLTGQTPNEFFKTFKLNKAAEMIKEGKYKISAISDMVGFSSPSHFAAAFQKQFGKLPSKY